MRKCNLIIMTVFFVSACGRQPSEAERNFNSLRDSVLVQHDEVMNNLGSISSLIQQMNEKIDSTKAKKNRDFEKASNHLKGAYQAMMNWMHQFNEDFPDINYTDSTYTENQYKERTKHLREYHKALSQVEHRVKKSIDDAKDLLKKD